MARVVIASAGFSEEMDFATASAWAVRAPAIPKDQRRPQRHSAVSNPRQHRHRRQRYRTDTRAVSVGTPPVPTSPGWKWNGCVQPVAEHSWMPNVRHRVIPVPSVVPRSAYPSRRAPPTPIAMMGMDVRWITAQRTAALTAACACSASVSEHRQHKWWSPTILA